MVIIAPDFTSLTDDELNQYIVSHYPDYAWMLNIPQVGDILRNAARHPDDPVISGSAAIQSQIGNTDWFRSTSTTQRQFQQLYATDPATLVRKIEDRKQEIVNWAAAAGIDTSTFDISALANDSLSYGWDDSQVRQSLVDRARYTGGQGGAYKPLTQGKGSIGQTMAQVKALAASYLMPFSDESAAQWATSIWDGRSTLEALQGTLGQQAKDAWATKNPAIGDAIDRGVSPLDFLQPQVSALASTLEIGAQQVNLLDPKWSKILNYDDGKGNLRIMTVPEVQQFARNQREYRYTTQANNDTDAHINKLLTTMGEVKGL